MMRQAWLRVGTRRLIVRGLSAALLLAYVASYGWLSRRGMAEAPEFGLDGFLYVPSAEAAASQDLSLHQALAGFYWPLNRIDQAAFRAPPPCGCIMWRLSG
ncbi:hypothetical protein TA3x_001002 [Tundrisphaera sp. TA3]|uniref:hypothetical protein n=1 Tax=Tundrisphaera sp. TA3 TaxID=3435775 RepID=UPI003EBE597E